MNNLLKTILTIVLLLFVFLGISAMYKSCKADEETDSTNMVEESSDDEYDIFDDNDDNEVDILSSDEDGDTSSDSGSTEEDGGSTIDYSEIDDALEEPVKEDTKPKTPVSSTPIKRTPTKKPASKPSPPKRVEYKKPSTGASDAKYLVIAGSYLVKDNAVKMQNKLGKLGYDNAEIVVFDERKYHTVCASKSNDYDTAVRQSNALKRKGVDSYVHTRQD